MSLPEQLYFMPADADDEPGIEVGDGRVMLLHPFGLDDNNVEEAHYVNDLYRAVVHRYNNFESLLAALENFLGDIDIVGDDFGFHCTACGREYSAMCGDTDVPMLCPSDDCPAHIARAAVAKAKGKQ